MKPVRAMLIAVAVLAAGVLAPRAGVASIVLLEKILAGDATASDFFGASVAVSGDTAVVGAYGAGAAYVFTGSGLTWTQQAKLVPAANPFSNSFGFSVAIEGDTILVGDPSDQTISYARGSAHVFTRSGSTWSPQAKLLASDGASSDNFGYTVSLSGDSALVGARQDNTGAGFAAGSAYVFTRSGSTWTQQQKLVAPDGAAGDNFSWGLDLDGDTALIGSYADDDLGDYSGSAYVFTRTGSVWSLQQKLVAPDGGASDVFGIGAMLIGDTAFIGAPNDDDNGKNAGAVYVFSRSGATWTYDEKILAPEGLPGSRFGEVMSHDGTRAIISARNRGAYVYTMSGGSLEFEVKLEGVFGDSFASGLAVTGDFVLVGAPLDDQAASNAGALYIYVDDVTPPSAILTETPGTFSTASATFAFSGTDDVAHPQDLTFECALDASPYAPCASPESLSGLADGGHTFFVRAIDTAGNVGASVSHAWTVETTPPDITGTASPASNGAGWNSTGVEVTFTCTDSESGVASCTPAVILSSEGAGQQVTGIAVDNAGNTASTVVGPINIDLTPPDAAIAAPFPPLLLSPAGDMLTGTASDSLSGVTAVSVTYTNMITGETTTVAATCGAGCGSPGTVDWSAPPPSPGLYSATAESTDAAGLTGASAPVTLIVV